MKNAWVSLLCGLLAGARARCKMRFRLSAKHRVQSASPLSLVRLSHSVRSLTPLIKNGYEYLYSYPPDRVSLTEVMTLPLWAVTAFSRQSGPMVAQRALAVAGGARLAENGFIHNTILVCGSARLHQILLHRAVGRSRRGARTAW